MSDLSVLKIGIGDEVRVHYHPPDQTMSFVEGVVSRVDVSTLLGRMFVVEVTYEVVLDREQPVKAGYQSYVLYERPDDFPGRIEVLSATQQQTASVPDQKRKPEADQGRERGFEAAPGPAQMADERPEQEPAPDPAPERAEDEGTRGLGGMIGALFGRRT